MVVIKGTRDGLNREYGKNFVEKLYNYSEIIGFTIEEEGDELKVEFNPDRPDLFSFVSLNRAMKCFYDRDFVIIGKNKASGLEMNVEKEVTKLREYVTGFIATGNKISSKLDHIIEYQERLHDTVGKNRSKVSIGIHDLDKISPPLLYCARGRGEVKFDTYDGMVTGTASEILKKHPKGVEFSKLIPPGDKVPLILDSENGVLSMPPVINGSKSKIDKETSSFFIDITGTDKKATRDAYFLFMYEFRNLGFTTKDISIIGESKFGDEIALYDGRNIDVSRASLARITGLDIGQEEAIQLLREMGYMAEPSSKFVSVKVPGNRTDVMGQVDVMEDIAKAYGISKIEEKKIDLPLIGAADKRNEFSNLLRDIMVGGGLQEVRSFVVSSPQHYRDIEYKGGIEIMNPKSVDYSLVRDRLYLNMMELLRINKRRALPHKIFEVGDVYSSGKQEMMLCAMIMDTKASYSAIKQILDYLALRLGIKSVKVQSSPEEGFIQGRSGIVEFDGKEVGIIGEIHPEVIESYDLTAPVCAFEVNVGDLLN